MLLAILVALGCAPPEDPDLETCDVHDWGCIEGDADVVRECCDRATPDDVWQCRFELDDGAQFDCDNDDCTTAEAIVSCRLCGEDCGV